jgi:hypothetical protein
MERPQISVRAAIKIVGHHPVEVGRMVEDRRLKDGPVRVMSRPAAPRTRLAPAECSMTLVIHLRLLLECGLAQT